MKYSFVSVLGLMPLCHILPFCPVRGKALKEIIHHQGQFPRPVQLGEVLMKGSHNVTTAISNMSKSKKSVCFNIKPNVLKYLECLFLFLSLL